MDKVLIPADQIDKIYKFAKRRFDEEIGEDSTDWRYWSGYLDGLKSIMKSGEYNVREA